MDYCNQWYPADQRKEVAQNGRRSRPATTDVQLSAFYGCISGQHVIMNTADRSNLSQRPVAGSLAIIFLF
jgi:hypothetical protein